MAEPVPGAGREQAASRTPTATASDTGISPAAVAMPASQLLPPVARAIRAEIATAPRQVAANNAYWTE